ncbi:hypothetical protein [Streptococcus suis]
MWNYIGLGLIGIYVIGIIFLIIEIKNAPLMANDEVTIISEEN